MEWYLKIVKDNYANFEGRARRKEFWMFALFNLIIAIGINALYSTANRKSVARPN
jgi:uncharacterized membrane protein YhaH (DUF805 family)